jgi:hypothetical protein
MTGPSLTACRRVPVSPGGIAIVAFWPTAVYGPSDGSLKRSSADAVGDFACYGLL